MKIRIAAICGVLAIGLTISTMMTGCGVPQQQTSSNFSPRWQMAATPAGTFLVNTETGEVALYANLVLINTPRAQLPNDVYQQLLINLFRTAATGTATPGVGTATPGAGNMGTPTNP